MEVWKIQKSRCAEYTVWEARLQPELHEADGGPITMFVDLQRAVKTVLVLRMLCGYFSHQTRVVFVCGAAAPVPTYTAMLLVSRFSVVLLRLVMLDAMRAVFNVWPEVRTKVYVDDKTFHVQAKIGRSKRDNTGSLRRTEEAHIHDKFETIFGRRRVKRKE